MEIFPTKPPALADASSPKGSVPSLALSAPFADVLQAVGGTSRNGTKAPPAQDPVFPAATRTDREPPEDPRREAKDLRSDQIDGRKDRPERHDANDGRSRTGPRDDHEPGTKRAAGPGDGGKAGDPGRVGPEDAGRESLRAYDADKSKGSAKAGGAKTADGDPKDDAGGGGAHGPETTEGVPPAAGQGPLATGIENAKGSLSALLANPQASGVAGQGAQQSGEQGSPGGHDGPGGPTKGLNALGGGAGAKGTGPAETGTKGQQAPPQVKAPATEQAQANTTVNNPALQQAAALSKLLGPGTGRVQVGVGVSQDSQSLVSQPGASLTPTSVLAGDGTSQPQNGPQAVPLHGPASPIPAGPQTPVGANAGQAQPTGAQGQAILAAAGTQDKGATTGSYGGGMAQGGGEAGSSAGPGGVAESHQTQQTSATHAAKPQTLNLPRMAAVQQVAVHITKALQSGMDKIHIQLRPESLGRVDVKLEVGHDGRVMAVVTADNKDTLDLLQKDSRDLQQAFRDAGLQADSGSLKFGLRGDGGHPENGTAAGGYGGETETAEGEEDFLGAPAVEEYAGDIVSATRVDIHA